MAFSDDVWAMNRLQTHKDIVECSSFRVSIDGSVHRFVTFVTATLLSGSRWMSLCGLHPVKCPPAVIDERCVTCFGCLAEGG